MTEAMQNQIRSISITVLLIVVLILLSQDPSDEASDRLEGMLYLLVPAFLDSARVARRSLTRRSKRDPEPPDLDSNPAP